MVREKVASGEYGTASDVVRGALESMRERDLLGNWPTEALRAQVQAGLDQLRAGELVPGDAVFEELSERSRRQRQRRA